jgi:signal transduction histidine kinase
LLLATDLSPEQKEYAGRTKTSAEALLPIINCILDFSEIEAGRPGPGQLDADLWKTIKNAADLLTDRAQEKGRDLK